MLINVLNGLFNNWISTHCSLPKLCIKQELLFAPCHGRAAWDEQQLKVIYSPDSPCSADPDTGQCQSRAGVRPTVSGGSPSLVCKTPAYLINTPVLGMPVSNTCPKRATWLAPHLLLRHHLEAFFLAGFSGSFLPAPFSLRHCLPPSMLHATY